MCRFCREDQSFEETAVIGKPKLCRSGKDSAHVVSWEGCRERSGAGACLQHPCCVRRWAPREGVGAASDDGEEADVLGCHRVERAVTGKASRGCYRVSCLRRVPGPFAMGVVHGQRVAWLLANEPWSRSSTFYFPVYI